MVHNIFAHYEKYIYRPFKDRFFKHSDLLALFEICPKVENEVLGYSTEGRSIHLLRMGNGATKILLWSQMHGDEPTATMALADFLEFLFSDDEFNSYKKQLLGDVTLYLIPMVNPDGAEYYIRRNAQQIDINRDFNAQQSPEGKILRTAFEKVKPQFCFNLHDMSPQWSAGFTGNPATVSFLAPAYDQELSINQNRELAMKVIAGMNVAVQRYIPNHVGIWDDEFEPRAFGDNFQKAGSSTILIETGGYVDDLEKQFVRKMAFLAVLSGLDEISNQNYLTNDVKDYWLIPENKKVHFGMIIRNCQMKSNNIEYKIDIALTPIQKLNTDRNSVNSTYQIEDLGDLEGKYGYEEIDATSFQVIFTEPPIVEANADFIVMDGLNRILSFENGYLSRN